MAMDTDQGEGEGEARKALKMEDMEEDRLEDIDISDQNHNNHHNAADDEEEEEAQSTKKSSEFSDMEDVDLGHGPETDAWAVGDEPVMVER